MRPPRDGPRPPRAQPVDGRARAGAQRREWRREARIEHVIQPPAVVSRDDQMSRRTKNASHLAQHRCRRRQPGDDAERDRQAERIRGERKRARIGADGHDVSLDAGFARGAAGEREHRARRIDGVDDMPRAGERNRGAARPAPDLEDRRPRDTAELRREPERARAANTVPVAVDALLGVHRVPVRRGDGEVRVHPALLRARWIGDARGGVSPV